MVMRIFDVAPPLNGSNGPDQVAFFRFTLRSRGSDLRSIPDSSSAITRIFTLVYTLKSAGLPFASRIVPLIV